MESPIFPIASFILHRPNPLSPVVRLADAREALGEAYGLAMSQGYLIPSWEDGGLYVTPEAIKMTYLRRVYEDESELEEGDEVVILAHGRAYPALVVEVTPEQACRVVFGEGGKPAGALKPLFPREEVKLKTRRRGGAKGNKAISPMNPAPHSSKAFWRNDLDQ